MILKVLTAIAIVGSTTLIGIKMSDKTKFRKNLFSDLTKFCQVIKSDIGFNYSTTDKLFSLLDVNTLQLIKVDCADYFIGNKVKINDKRLSFEESEKISDFFNSLGSFGEEGTFNMVTYYCDYFSGKYAECDETYKKTRNFYIKIGALTGVLIYLIVV